MATKVQNTELKVGPIVYDISLVSDLRSDDGESLLGKVKYEACEIHLEAGNSPQMDRQTLWHELVHITMEQLGRDHSDESFVDSLAYSLMQVVQDNPWLAEMTR